LDEILRAILVGITAEEGLGFNRAFLAMFDEKETILEGRLAIGPSCREEAGRVWAEMREKRYNFLDIVQNLKTTCHQGDIGVNRIVADMEIPVTHKDNILIRSALERRSIKVDSNNGCIPIAIERRMRNLFFYHDGGETFPFERRSEANGEAAYSIPHDLISLLGEDSFVVVPLYSPRRSFGVIIADNFVTRQPLSEGHINSLELFASQASLAIEHSNLYIDMQLKIGELQALNHELDKNKDLLVAAERYSALGQMAAQLVHAIRNPVTSIGGVSRILTKKIADEDVLKYLHVIIKETERLESTLADLFDFVTDRELQKERIPLYTVIKKTVMLVQNTISDKSITLEYALPGHELELDLDLAQFRQMFLHLVRNAIDAMPNGGTLSINVIQENGFAVIRIADTGMGIPNGYIDHAKDPFFTTKTYGTGMGLALVERVVKAHGGEFHLMRREAGGMEARIHFPLPQ
jgi:signal transduction histidine kinase